MKIEVGESLFYSWLRHVKECQLVQTNWKASKQWNLQHEDELVIMMNNASEYFSSKYGYEIFKKTSSLSQLIQQGECDAIGISITDGNNQYYAVDVAFHEGGLNYGSKEETVMKVIAKSIRTAMCLYGYFDTKKADIVFASPKINPAILPELESSTVAVNALFHYWGYDFKLRIIANEEFNDSVLKPILMISDGIADTNELFIRSYQMYTMFSESPTTERAKVTKTHTSRVERQKEDVDYENEDVYSELKIGQIVRVVLRNRLKEGCVSEEEIRLLQDAEYSKREFDIQYPLLVSADSEYEKIRYYKDPVILFGNKYYICSQWFETTANNDRPYLLRWLTQHKS